MTFQEYKEEIFPKLLEKRLEKMDKEGQEKLDLGYGENEQQNQEFI